jgi:hypothetical protein
MFDENLSGLLLLGGRIVVELVNGLVGYPLLF